MILADMIFYVENPLKSTEILLELIEIQHSCKIQIKIQKIILFLYTVNESSKK